MSTEIVVLKPIEADLAALSDKYKSVVYDVTTAGGMTQAKAAKKEIAGYRIALEKAREKEKEASLTYGRKVDSEARAIGARIAALEDPITTMIETETKRAER